MPIPIHNRCAQLDSTCAPRVSSSVQAQVRVFSVTDSHVEFEPISPGTRGACARCDQGVGCGQSLLLRLGKRSSGRVRLRSAQLIHQDNSPPLIASGMLCRLEMTTGSLLKMTLLLYGLPLCGLLAGTGLAVAAMAGLNPEPSALQQDLLAAGSGLLGLLAGARIVKKLSPECYCDVRLHPQV